MPDIAEFLVKIDSQLNELKRLSRNMHNPDSKRIIDLVLDMRWQLANVLTTIGKEEKDRDDNNEQKEPT